MSVRRPSVILVDDDAAALASLQRALAAQLPHADIIACGGAGEALRSAGTRRSHVAVVDLCLDDRGVEGGFVLIDQLRRNEPGCRIIVLTGHGAHEHGVRALEHGAASFLQKPADIAHLAALVRDGIGQADLRRAYHAARRGVEGELLLGESPAMKLLRDQLHFLASTSQPVLLCGETGSGKGICAQALHSWGPRRSRPLVRYQPAFGTPDLVNSELFGHVRGAFTGAVADRIGVLKQADRGTLFLDEIDQLPRETQVALLGTLQDKRFRAVGAMREEGSDFRLVCATNADLTAAMEQGRVRRDFYFRVAHARLEVPALRDRREDIAVLARHFLSNVARRESLSVYAVEPAALALLERHSWPGNVRELEALIEAGALRAHFERRGTVGCADLVLPSQAAAAPLAFNVRVEAFKLKLIREALQRCAGNQVRAAKELGLDRSTLRRILHRAEAAACGTVVPLFSGDESAPEPRRSKPA